MQAHGLVAWRDRFVMLDSGNGALVLVDPRSSRVEQVWMASHPRHCLMCVRVPWSRGRGCQKHGLMAQP